MILNNEIDNDFYYFVCYRLPLPVYGFVCRINIPRECLFYENDNKACLSFRSMLVDVERWSIPSVLLQSKEEKKLTSFYYRSRQTHPEVNLHTPQLITVDRTKRRKEHHLFHQVHHIRLTHKDIRHLQVHLDQDQIIDHHILLHRIK